MVPGVAESILSAEHESGVFGAADYRTSFRFKKFKIAYPIWPSRFINESDLLDRHIGSAILN